MLGVFCCVLIWDLATRRKRGIPQGPPNPRECPTFLIIEGMTALDTINGALRSMSALFKKDFAVKILAAADN